MDPVMLVDPFLLGRWGGIAKLHARKTKKDEKDILWNHTMNMGRSHGAWKQDYSAIFTSRIQQIPRQSMHPLR